MSNLIAEKNDSPPITSKKNLSEPEPKSDKLNYLLLIFLYVLQGIFRGLLHAVPLILHERGVSYEQQALLEVSSLAGWLKILWAPLVECIYIVDLGKRKSWLIPCQYLLGLITFVSSFQIETWLGNNGGTPNVLPICIVFFFCTFLLTTLDMVVDSWALTMLQRENVGYQATCNIIGGRLGHFLGFVLLILLSSEEMSGYLGAKKPILNLSGYLMFWSVVLLICNTGIWFFKKDNSLEIIGDGEEQQLNIVKSYKLIWETLNLKAVRQLSIILLLCKAGIGPIIGLTNLKLIRGGLKTDKLVLMAIPLIPLQSILPFFLRRYFEGSQGLERFSRTLLYMIPVGLMFCMLIYYMPELKEGGKLTATFYVLYFIIHGLEYMVMFLMAAGFMSFTAKICDPKFGAVYLTVIQTIRSAGFMWPLYLSMFLSEPLTFYKSDCIKEIDKRGCVLVDGYYIEVLIGSLFSICFLYFGGLKAMLKIQNFDESVWRIGEKKKNDDVERTGDAKYVNGQIN